MLPIERLILLHNEAINEAVFIMRPGFGQISIVMSWKDYVFLSIGNLINLLHELRRNYAQNLIFRSRDRWIVYFLRNTFHSMYLNSKQADEFNVCKLNGMDPKDPKH